MQPNNGLQVLDGGERAGGSPPRRRRSGTVESLLEWCLREAVILSRGRKDPLLTWLLHKCVERASKGKDHE